MPNNKCVLWLIAAGIFSLFFFAFDGSDEGVNCGSQIDYTSDISYA